MSKFAILSSASQWNSEIPAASISAEDALSQAGLNYTVKKIANQYEIDGTVYDGKEFQVVRSDNNGSVACVGSKFVPVQNQDMFADIHRVAAANNATLTGAGQIGGGEYTFVQYKLPQEITVPGRKGDISELYLLAFNNFSGTKYSFLTVFTNRLFCLNQSRALRMNNAQLDGTGFYHRIGHNAQHKTRLAIANETFSEAVAGAVAISEFNAAMEAKPMDKGEMKAFTEVLLPTPEDKEEAGTRLHNTRESIIGLFSRGEGNLGRSRYDAFQAVVEFTNHERSTKETQGKSRHENRLVSIMPGGNNDRLITRAAELLLA